jgi:hypothetical protein
MEFFFIDLSAIDFSFDTTNIDTSEIELIAEAIVECGGLIKPLILISKGFREGEERFDLVDDPINYLAAVRAKKLNPELEMVNAFVIKPTMKGLVTKQIKLV